MPWEGFLGRNTEKTGRICAEIVYQASLDVTLDLNLVSQTESLVKVLILNYSSSIHTSLLAFNAQGIFQSRVA